jgi:hypothetical protein
MTNEQVAELKAKYPGRRLLKLSSDAATVAALSPNWDEVSELKEMLNAPARAGASMEWLIRKCVVHPPESELNALLARKPLLVEGWYKQLRNEAGYSEEVAVDAVPECDVAAFASLYPQQVLYGRSLVKLGSPAGRVVAKVPSPLEMREFRRRNHAGESETALAEWLARSCVVEPDSNGLNAILDRKPLLVEKWFAALVNAGGAAEKIVVGEL